MTILLTHSILEKIKNEAPQGATHYAANNVNDKWWCLKLTFDGKDVSYRYSPQAATHQGGWKITPALHCDIRDKLQIDWCVVKDEDGDLSHPPVGCVAYYTLNNLNYHPCQITYVVEGDGVVIYALDYGCEMFFNSGEVGFITVQEYVDGSVKLNAHSAPQNDITLIRYILKAYKPYDTQAVLPLIQELVNDGWFDSLREVAGEV